MWIYEKKLQYPVKIKTPNPRLAQIIISQLGGPDGEIGASMRYLNQRYSMPEKQVAGLLTDIGTEELAHVEMVSAILYQLTRNLPADSASADTGWRIPFRHGRAPPCQCRSANPRPAFPAWSSAD